LDANIFFWGCDLGFDLTLIKRMTHASFILIVTSGEFTIKIAYW